MKVLSDEQIEYINAVLKDLAQETDRAAAVLLAAEIDRVLLQILEKFLLPARSSASSSLLEPDGPIGTLASRIELLYRLGLISAKMHRELHLLRKIRNHFAHHVQGVGFDRPPVSDLINSLFVHKWIVAGNPSLRVVFDSPRRPFIISGAAVVGCLTSLANRIEKREEHDSEFKPEMKI